MTYKMMKSMAKTAKKAGNIEKAQDLVFLHCAIWSVACRFNTQNNITEKFVNKELRKIRTEFIEQLQNYPMDEEDIAFHKRIVRLVNKMIEAKRA